MYEAQNPSVLSRISAQPGAQAEYMLPPDSGGGSYTKVVCNHYYSWRDAAGGSIQYQHACGGRTSPWGVTVPAWMARSATGPATETGMSWLRIPAGKWSKGAPHRVWPSYHFHGTFNPVLKNDRIQFYDRITFPMRYPNGSVGPMTVTIQGNVWQTN